MRKIPYLLFAGFIIIADQLSKWAVSEYLIRPAGGDGTPMDLAAWFAAAPPRLPYAEIEVLPFFNMVMIWNQGISFGLFTQNSGSWVLIILSFIITLWFVIWLFKTQDRLQLTAIALVIGGALGNVIDRFRFGAVIDFLDFHLGGWHWPAFNIADICIVIGVFGLIFHSFFCKTPEFSIKGG